MKNQILLHRIGIESRSTTALVNCLTREQRSRQEELVGESGGLLGGAGVIFEWHGAEQRAGMNVSSASSGGYLVGGEAMQPASALRNRMVLESLGTRVFAGLKSDCLFSRIDAAAGAAWMSETAAATPSSWSLKGLYLTPKRITTTRNFTNQLLAQGEAIEPFLQAELFGSLGELMQNAVIAGNGAAELTGILQIPSISSVVGGTNGAAPTYSNLCDLEYAVTGTGNADLGHVGWITSPKARRKLRQTFVNGGGSGPVWALDAASSLLGRPAGVTNSSPDTLVKGTSGAACSSIICADFSELIVGIWGAGIEVTVDPYTLATSGQTVFTATAFVDSGFRTSAAIAAMQDALC